jgi:4-amino-4-deoxy-L-arabinose transferase-like glycosyltransferase
MNTLKRFLAGESEQRTYVQAAICFLVFACAVFFLFKLGSIGFLGPDEPRYAQVAREMKWRNDWVTPTLLGKNWFEKPVLMYWLAGIAYRLFGENEWAARLPSALLGISSVFALFYFGKRIGGLKFGFFAGMVLASSIVFFSFSRAASFDIYLTAATFGAFISFFLTEAPKPSTRTRATIFFYVFIGIGLLAKGLVGGMIPAGGIFIYFLMRHRLNWRGWLKATLELKPWIGAPIVLLVAGTWYGPVIARNGWPFIEDFFIAHHFQRFTTNRFHHPGPVYYYIPVLLLGMLPWTVFFLIGLWRNLRAALEQFREKETETTEIKRLGLVSLGWFLFPVLFFSFSGSKLPGYVLPAVPMAAILTAFGLSEITGKTVRLTGGITLFLQLVLIVALPLAAKTQFKIQPFGLALALTGVAAVATGMYFLLKRERPLESGIAAAFFHALMLIQATAIFPAAEDRESQKVVSLSANQGEKEKEPLTFFRCRKYAPVFYNYSQVQCCDEEREPNRYDKEEELLTAFGANRSMIVICPATQVPVLQQSKFFQSEVLESRDKFAAVRLFRK